MEILPFLHGRIFSKIRFARRVFEPAVRPSRMRVVPRCAAQILRVFLRRILFFGAASAAFAAFTVLACLSFLGAL